MKTKLTLVLALILTTGVQAQKPNFNTPKPAASPAAPPPRASPAPSSSGGGASRRVNVGQIIGIARTVLPLIQSMRTPRQAPPAPPKQNPPATVKKPVVAKKPATNRSTFKAPAAATIPNQAPAARNTPDSRLGGLSGQQAAGIQQGREIAEGLASLESLRASFGSLEGLGDVFHQPGNADPSAARNPAETFGEGSSEYDDGSVDIHNPLDKGSRPGAGLTDIRAGASNSRHSTRAEPGTFTSFGLRLATSGPHTSSTHIWANGNTTYGSSDTEDGTHLTTEFIGSNGHVTGRTDTWTHSGSTGSSRTTDTYDENGVFMGSETITNNDDGSSQSKSVAADGSVVVTENDGHGHVTQYVSPSSTGSHSRGLRPDENAAQGGLVGPSVQEVIGLTDLDLLRQHANGEAPSGGSNYMTRRTNAVQVLPPSPDGTTRGTRRVAPIDLLQPEGPGVNVIGGGDRPN